jgi:hypothetical protein
VATDRDRPAVCQRCFNHLSVLAYCDCNIAQWWRGLARTFICVIDVQIQTVASRCAALIADWIDAELERRWESNSALQDISGRDGWNYKNKHTPNYAPRVAGLNQRYFCSLPDFKG